MPSSALLDDDDDDDERYDLDGDGGVGGGGADGDLGVGGGLHAGGGGPHSSSASLPMTWTFADDAEGKFVPLLQYVVCHVGADALGQSEPAGLHVNPGARPACPTFRSQS